MVAAGTAAAIMVVVVMVAAEGAAADGPIGGAADEVADGGRAVGRETPGSIAYRARTSKAVKRPPCKPLAGQRTTVSGSQSKESWSCRIGVVASCG
jgi:hypothetical protein